MKRIMSTMLPIVLIGMLAIHCAASAQAGPGGPGPGASDHGPPGGPGGPDGLGPPPGPGGPGGPGGPRERFGPPPGPGGLRVPPPEAFERLGLSDAQRTRIDALREADQRRAIRDDAEVRIAEMDLQTMVEGDRPDEAAIGTAIEKLMAARTAELKARAATIVAMRAVLTPAQRAKMRRPNPDARWH